MNRAVRLMLPVAHACFTATQFTRSDFSSRDRQVRAFARHTEAASKHITCQLGVRAATRHCGDTAETLRLAVWQPRGASGSERQPKVSSRNSVWIYTPAL